MPYTDPKARRRYQRKYYREHYSEQGRSKVAERKEKRLLFSTRLPESIIARMRKMVDEGIATGKYPWRSMAAVTQALILGGFESMKGDEFVDELLPYLRSMAHIEGVRNHRTEAQSALSRLKTEISELIAIKAHDEAATYFQGVLHDFDQMAPNVWRDWMIRESRKAFPALLHYKVKSVVVVPVRTKQKRVD